MRAFDYSPFYRASVGFDRVFDLLDNVAKVLAAHPEIKKVRVEGHTDNVGKPEVNKDLSERRAKAVVKWLTTKGKIAADRLERRGVEHARRAGEHVAVLHRDVDIGNPGTVTAVGDDLAPRGLLDLAIDHAHEVQRLIELNHDRVDHDEIADSVGDS